MVTDSLSCQTAYSILPFLHLSQGDFISFNHFFFFLYLKLLIAPDALKEKEISGGRLIIKTPSEPVRAHAFVGYLELIFWSVINTRL